MPKPFQVIAAPYLLLLYFVTTPRLRGRAVGLFSEKLAQASRWMASRAAQISCSVVAQPGEKRTVPWG